MDKNWASHSQEPMNELYQSISSGRKDHSEKAGKSIYSSLFDPKSQSTRPKNAADEE